LNSGGELKNMSAITLLSRISTNLVSKLRILQIISKAMNFFQPADIKKRKRTNTVGSGNDELISLLTRMLTPLKYELSRVNIFQPRSKINFASNKNLSDIEVFRTQI
jgi:hypothetical protein